jgi:tetratricopeptide (TPR) repeat protein
MVLRAIAAVSLTCTQVFGEGPMALEEDLARARELRSLERHEDAARIYTRLLKNPTLPRESRIRVHFDLAQTLEAIPGFGEQARQTYAEIRQAYPQHWVAIEAAYRLGCLYDSILLPGTQKSVRKAVEQFQYVLANCPKNTMLALKAQMNLGNLAAEMKELDQAQGHFRAIYEAKGAALAHPGQLEGLREGEREETLKRLADEFKYMKARAGAHMVETCIRDDPAESLLRLARLREHYPDDPQINALAGKTGGEVVRILAREDHLNERIRSMAPEACPSAPEGSEAASTRNPTRGGRRGSPAPIDLEGGPQTTEGANWHRKWLVPLIGAGAGGGVIGLLAALWLWKRGKAWGPPRVGPGGGAQSKA